MALIDQHAPGSFCWIELGTTDQNAAKEFYQPLFGWTSNDFPMGPSEFYTMFQIDGCDCAAAFTLNAEMRERGVPPHWMPYVAVVSADEAAAKASESGGSVIAGPFDVGEFGRMAVLMDPAGAAFSVWQPKSHKGTGITDVPGTICWADLSTPDAAAAAGFYKGMFGWETMEGKDGYLHIKNGEAFIGGMPAAAQRNPNLPPHWMVYFTVEDCDASAAKAKESGATIYVEPMTIETVGRMAVLADPQGALSALFQPLPREQA